MFWEIQKCYPKWVGLNYFFQKVLLLARNLFWDSGIFLWQIGLQTPTVCDICHKKVLIL